MATTSRDRQDGSGESGASRGGGSLGGGMGGQNSGLGGGRPRMKDKRSTQQRNFDTLEGLTGGKPSRTPETFGDRYRKGMQSDYGSLATVPGRTRAPNFNRAPTLSELQTMGTIIGGVAMASPASIIKGISESLNGVDFQGAVSKGSGEVEAKGQSGEGLSDEEKLKRKRLAQQTLLGSSGPAAGTLGASAKPVKI